MIFNNEETVQKPQTNAGQL